MLILLIFSFLEPGIYGGVEWNFYHHNYGRILGWADGEFEDFDIIVCRPKKSPKTVNLTNGWSLKPGVFTSRFFLEIHNRYNHDRTVLRNLLSDAVTNATRFWDL